MGCSSIQEISFKCIYNIKDNEETQIINNGFEDYINNEIESKIKILNGNQKEKLVFKKKFDKIGINTIDFIIESNLNDMSFMFSKCSSLKGIEFISFESSTITNMQGMFNECTGLENLDLSGFDTSNVTNMNTMFNGCIKLKEIKGINKLNTINVTNMGDMFNECNNLEFLDLTNFDTSNVKDMKTMFNGCIKLKEIIGINNFKTMNVTDMGGMFRECNNL